jgi:hypothetical protein
MLKKVKGILARLRVKDWQTLLTKEAITTWKRLFLNFLFKLNQQTNGSQQETRNTST